MIRSLVLVATTFVLSVAVPARAEFPYPPCGGCADPSDYQAYMFNPTVSPPVLPNEVTPLDFRYSSLVDPSLPATAAELFGVAGMSIDVAWQITTGRPDVVIAIIDSGIIYSADTINKAALNPAELPLPEGSALYDSNGDGVFNVQDYATDSRVLDDGNGMLDPRDLIQSFSDGVDDDGNGYVDDICGWDVHEHDNDPFDDVSYGHGTGEAKGAAGEVNNGGAFAAAPNARFLPIKVSDSFLADINDFGAAVAFAVDSGVTIVSEALGTLNNTPFARAAVEYARDNGVLVVASAADEQSYHHNFPAQYEHVFWANSVRPEDGLLVLDATNLLLNGCTNFGGKADVSIASTACSSEATELASGMFALLYSAALNEIDRGNIFPHPVTGTALSPIEALQLLRRSADDVDFAGNFLLTADSGLSLLMPQLVSQRFPTHAGFDKFTGYGRANAAAAVAMVGPGTIPPEADIDSPWWFSVIDPNVTPSLDITGTVAAERNGNNYSYSVEWACGVDPLEADFAGLGHQLISVPMVGSSIRGGLLATLDTTVVDAECLFASITLPRLAEDDFDESYAITLRVSVDDTLGNHSESRKNVFVYSDPTLRPGFPINLGTSGDSSPVLVDLDGDGVQEIVLGTADGFVHAFKSDGSEVTGWPVTTNLIDLNTGSPAYQFGALGSNFHAAVIGPVAVGDLDGSGTPEVVACDTEGSCYVFESSGATRAGFPVSLDPVFSDPAIRNETNRLDAMVLAAPTLADLDQDGSLEIIVAAGDRHLYVWNADGTTHSGFPVLIVDQERMQSVDAVTHQVVWKTASGGGPVGSRGTKLVGSPSVGDIDGDGDLEIIVGSNEEYVHDEDANFFIGGLLFSSLSSALDLANGRLYAVSHLGADDPAVQANPSGPFVEGWPVRIGLLLSDLLPTVGHGVNASPVLADIDDDGADEIFISGNNGVVLGLEGDGTSVYGSFQGKFLPLSPDTAPASNPGATTVDFPLTFALVGSGAAGDVNADGVLDYMLPSVGITQLLDNQAGGLQGPGDHQMVAWSTDTGKVLADFPQRVEDLQFLSSPAIADLDSDGIAEVLAGSGGYYLHAFSGTGGQPAGWPKFTGGWTLGSVAVGDVDGNDTIDVVATTREGFLYAWEQSGSYSSTGIDTVQWAGYARDAHNTGNIGSGVPTAPMPAGCSRVFRLVLNKVVLKYGSAALDDKVKLKGLINAPGASFDPLTETVAVRLGDPAAAVFSAQVNPGLFTSNTKGTVFKFKDPTLTLAGGLKKVLFKLKKGKWQWQFQAKNVDAQLAGDQAVAFVQIGDDCFQRLRACKPSKNGKSLKCK